MTQHAQIHLVAHHFTTEGRCGTLSLCLVTELLGLSSFKGTLGPDIAPIVDDLRVHIIGPEHAFEAQVAQTGQVDKRLTTCTH